MPVYPLVLVLLSLYALVPWLLPNFLASDDGLFHLYRLVALDQAIKGGSLYPRWAGDFFYGYGFPIFNYYPPLTYYAAEALHLLGLAYVASLKGVVVLGMVASGLGAYGYGRQFLSKPASFLVGLAYMYVPFHLVDLYTRGDVSEFLAFAWLPLILWAFGKIVAAVSWRIIPLAALTYAGLILTHNLAAFLFTPFLALYCLAGLGLRYTRQRDRRGLVLALAWIITAGALAYGLSACYWLPALGERGYVHIGRLQFYRFWEHFATLPQLMATSPVHGYFRAVFGDKTFQYRLGLVQVVLGLLGVLLLLGLWRRWGLRLRLEGLFALFVIVSALFFTQNASIWFWERIPLLTLAQFPWRFLLLVALPSAVLAGFILEAFWAPWRLWAVVIISPVIIGSSVLGLAPVQTLLTEAHLDGRGIAALELTYGLVGTTSTAEYVPVGVKEQPMTSPMVPQLLLGQTASPLYPKGLPEGVEVEIRERRNASGTYRLRLPLAAPVTFNTVYFPGWQAWVDGVEQPIQVSDPEGLITLSLPPGEHQVQLRFGDTPLRMLSNLLAGSSWVILVGLSFFAFPRQRQTTPIGFSDGGLVRHKRRAVAGVVLLVLYLTTLAWFWRSQADRFGPQGPYQHPALAQLGAGIAFLGYDLTGPGQLSQVLPSFSTGSQVNVALYWRLLADQRDDDGSLAWFARLMGGDQSWAYAEADLRPAPRSEVRQTVLQLPVPTGLPTHVYHVEVGVYSRATGRELPVARYRTVPLFLIPLEARNYALPLVVMGPEKAGGEMPKLRYPAKVNFENKLTLLGYDILDGGGQAGERERKPLLVTGAPEAMSVAAGETIHLDLLWQAKVRLDQEYVVTARLADGASLLHAIRDERLGGVRYPAVLWKRDGVVRGQMDLRLPAETMPGRYSLRVEIVSPTRPLSILDDQGAPQGPTLVLGDVLVTPTKVLPTAVKPRWQRSLNQPLTDALQLLGYSLGRKEAGPGERVEVELYWKATGKIMEDLRLRLALVDDRGKAWGSLVQRPGGDDYPTTAWRPGEVLRGKYLVPVEASTPTGSPSLQLRLEGQDGQALSELALDNILVAGRPRAFAVPAKTQPMNVILGGNISLVGYTLAIEGKEGEAATVAPGDTLLVTPYWRSEVETKVNYAISAQMVDASGRLVVQHDGPPQGGQAPTSGWVVGEVVEDLRQLALPKELPAGEYRVLVAVYEARSGQRLTTNEGADHIVLKTVRVETS